MILPPKPCYQHNIVQITWPGYAHSESPVDLLGRLGHPTKRVGTHGDPELLAHLGCNWSSWVGMLNVDQIKGLDWCWIFYIHQACNMIWCDPGTGGYGAHVLRWILSRGRSVGGCVSSTIRCTFSVWFEEVWSTQAAPTVFQNVVKFCRKYSYMIAVCCSEFYYQEPFLGRCLRATFCGIARIKINGGSRVSTGQWSCTSRLGTPGWVAPCWPQAAEVPESCFISVPCLWGDCKVSLEPPLILGTPQNAQYKKMC